MNERDLRETHRKSAGRWSGRPAVRDALSPCAWRVKLRCRARALATRARLPAAACCRAVGPLACSIAAVLVPLFGSILGLSVLFVLAAADLPATGLLRNSTRRC